MLVPIPYQNQHGETHNFTTVPITPNFKALRNRNTNIEIRIKFEIINTNDQNNANGFVFTRFEFWTLAIVSDFVLRIYFNPVPE